MKRLRSQHDSLNFYMKDGKGVENKYQPYPLIVFYNNKYFKFRFKCLGFSHWMASTLQQSAPE